MNTLFQILAGALLVAVTTGAEPMPPPAGGSGAEKAGPAMKCECQKGWHHGEMMGCNFFCPELVMRYQKELALTPDQQATMKKEMMDHAAHLTDLRWQQSTEKGVLADLLKQAKPDKEAILAQEGKVLKIGDDFKLSNLAVLVDIKNALTPEQQTMMGELQMHAAEHHMGHHMGHHGWWRHMHHGKMMDPKGCCSCPPAANPK
jgi:Spy/CpxP family protein refolding chaperone